MFTRSESPSLVSWVSIKKLGTEGREGGGRLLGVTDQTTTTTTTNYVPDVLH